MTPIKGFVRSGRAIALVAGITAGAIACSSPLALTQQVEARRLASELQLAFTKSADAANRAVMADTDEASAAEARQAEQAAQAASRNSQQLRPVLNALGYSEELRLLEAFDARFAEYRKLDSEVLPLAVENTNLKAQRLSFGGSAEAASSFRTALDAAVKLAAPGNASRAEALAARAIVSLLDVRVLQAPHIAESEDAAMTRMEQQMADSEKAVRRDLDQLKSLLGPGAASSLAAAAAAFDRFVSVNNEIVALSRRNSNVRSLALSLGRKRTVVAECDDQLRALQDALSRHSLAATR